MSPSQTGPSLGQELYLDLLMRTLTGAVSEDNDLILGGVRSAGLPGLRRRAGGEVGRLASRFGFELAYKKPYDRAAREVGRDHPERSETMIGLARMRNIRHCVECVMADGIEGDLIETGVWRGGATIFMRGILKAYGDTSRTVWCADSFQGLPAPDPARYPADAGDTFFKQSGLAVGVDQVKRNFARYGLLDDQVRFLVGWFKDTLATAPIDRLAVMRLDGDLYESTWQAIEALYPKLAPGGFCIVDDYGDLVNQCQRAIHDYRDAHGIDEEIINIDGFGAYWRKAA